MTVEPTRRSLQMTMLWMLRDEAGISVSDVAKRAKLSEGYLRDLEAGQTLGNLSEYARIAEALGADGKMFIGGPLKSVTETTKCLTRLRAVANPAA